MPLRLFLRFFLAVFSASTSLAAPPFLTGDSGVPEAKRLETIAGWTTERRPGERLAGLPVFELNYGLAPQIEIGYISRWVSAQPENKPKQQGYSNSLVAAKWRFLEEEKNGVSMAVSPSFEFRNPGSHSAKRGLVSDENTAGIDVRADRSFGPIAVTASLGRLFPSKSDGSWTYGLLGQKEITQTLGLGLEVVGDADSLGHNRILLNAGVQIVTGANSQMLLGLGRELHNKVEPRLTLRTYLGWQQTF